MRDVSSKYQTLRTARAAATLRVAASTIEAIQSGNVPKADPVGVARVAGIQAAKNTATLLPYCHQVPLDYVGIDIVLEAASIVVTTEVKAIWKTGVEMEALVAASVASLTLYDMLKGIDDGMEIGTVRLLEKKGGTSDIKASGSGMAAAVLVISDSVHAGTRTDTSGRLAVERQKGLGFHVTRYKYIPDDRTMIEQELRELTDSRSVDLIITTGGTGVGQRDVTPEATNAIIDRRLGGVEEVLRTFGRDRTPTAMLSRGVAGTCGHTLVVNLPGSKTGVEDGMSALFPAIFHAFAVMRGEGH